MHVSAKQTSETNENLSIISSKERSRTEESETEEEFETDLVLKYCVVSMFRGM